MNRTRAVGMARVAQNMRRSVPLSTLFRKVRSLSRLGSFLACFIAGRGGGKLAPGGGGMRRPSMPSWEGSGKEAGGSPQGKGALRVKIPQRQDLGIPSRKGRT